ncbi:MAG: class I SAM-dependent methyltransferase [Pseudomonadota bacterium]
MNPSDPIMAKTRQTYREQAQTYDAVRHRNGSELVWLERFLEAFPDGHDILDLGCGNGEPFTRALLGKGFNLTGVDFSPELLAISEARYPNARWLEGDLRHLDFGDETFDGLICWGVMFHLTQEDQRQLIRDMAGLLNPGGIIMMTIGDQAGEGEGFVGDAKVYHASLSVESYKATLKRAGFDILRLTIRDEDCGGATVVLAQKCVRTG